MLPSLRAMPGYAFECTAELGGGVVWNFDVPGRREEAMSIINMAVQTDYAGRTGRKQGRVAFLPARYNAAWSTSAARAPDVAIVHFAGKHCRHTSLARL